jgi:hypothetical protein
MLRLFCRDNFFAARLLLVVNSSESPKATLCYLPARRPAAKTKMSDSAAALTIVTPAFGVARSCSVTFLGPPTRISSRYSTKDLLS